MCRVLVALQLHRELSSQVFVELHVWRCSKLSQLTWDHCSDDIFMWRGARGAPVVRCGAVGQMSCLRDALFGREARGI